MDNPLLFQNDWISITQLDFFYSLLISTGIGFVFGLEREHAAVREGIEPFAGLRTFVLVALLGSSATFLSLLFSFWIMVSGFLALGGLVIHSYRFSAKRGDLGGTSELAVLLAYFLGSLVMLGFHEGGISIAVIAVVFLSAKIKMHALAGQVTREELFALIQFVVLFLLILPVLPNRTFGPYQVLNLYEIGWVVVLTSGVGFGGYLLMKFLGQNKGILWGGILGGLVSSTAVTWIFAKKSRQSPEISTNCASAILAASTVMCIRVLIWIFIFKKEMLNQMFLPLNLIFWAGLGTAYWYYRHMKSQMVQENLPLGKPLELGNALFFSIVYSGILLLVAFASDRSGAGGIYFSSVLASLTDIDAITISLTKMADNQINRSIAETAILIAMMGNTLVKLGITIFRGNSALSKKVLIGYGVMFLAAVIGLGLIRI